MKKLAFLILILATCYLAAMYRSLPLMALGLTELLLFIILFILSRYFRKKLTASFLQQSDSTEDGVNTVCRVLVHNSGRLPVSKIALRLRFRYSGESKSKKKKLYGGGERGESNLEFQVRAEYCGLIRVQIDRLRAYDYLSFFSSKKKLKEEMRIAVFPKEQALHIEIPVSWWEESRSSEDQTISHPGDAYNEIRQIREYRTGDSNRYIHWNQSAKMDQLWIKEYEKETDSQIDVLADIKGISDISLSERSAFYKLLSALTLGLLKEVAAVRVYWYQSSRGSFVSMSITNMDQCRDMLFALYQAELGQGSGLTQEITEENFSFDQHFIKLTLSLDLFEGTTFLHQFSMEKLQQEIQETFITI